MITVIHLDSIASFAVNLKIALEPDYIISNTVPQECFGISVREMLAVCHNRRSFLQSEIQI